MTEQEKKLRAVQILDFTGRFMNMFFWLVTIFMNAALAKDLMSKLIMPMELTEALETIKITIAISVAFFYALIWTSIRDPLDEYYDLRYLW